MQRFVFICVFIGTVQMFVGGQQPLQTVVVPNSNVVSSFFEVMLN
jgi:hypothetical protein